MATRTARDLITTAFRRLGIVSEDESVTAEQGDQGLVMLNDMMNGFEAEGIQYSHTDLTLDSTVNVPDHLVRSVMWMFADEVADTYGKVLTERQQVQVGRARGNLQAFYFEVPQAVTDEGIVNRRGLSGYIPITRL